MVARRILKTRTMAKTLSSLDGKRLIVRTAIPLGGGKVLEPGTDVTEEASTWSTLWTHVKRGTIAVVETAQAVGAVAKAISSPSASSVASAAKEVSEAVSAIGDAVAALRGMNGTASKADLRAALIACGIEPPAAATRDDLYRLRADVLATRDTLATLTTDATPHEVA